MLTSQLNKRNHDGSINLLKVNGSDHGVIVSPYHPDFYTQIEDNILPLVKTLCNIGFYVIDSCEGHFDEYDYDNAHIAIAFPSSNSLHNFLCCIKDVWCISVIVKDTWLAENDEIGFINNMFMTNHQEFIFVSVQIFKSNTIYKLLPKIIKRKITNALIDKLVCRIENEYINKPHLLL